jgi:pimeloyl-ACP methyl ester carboxylesterase
VGPALAALDWTVVAPDLPGHGDGPRPAGASVPAEAAAQLRRSLAGEQFDVVAGHSFGAAVALHLLVEDPAVAAAAVLEEPPGPHSVAWDLEAAAVLEGAASAREDPAGALRRTAAEQPRWAAEDCRHAVEDLARCRAEEVAAGLARGAGWTPRDVLAGVRTPVLLLLAPDAPGRNRLEDATALRGADRARFRALLGDRIQVVHAGHCIHRDAPDEWVAALAAADATGAGRGGVRAGS